MQYIFLKLDENGNLKASEVTNLRLQIAMRSAAGQTGTQIYQMFPQVMAKKVAGRNLWCAEVIDSDKELPVFLCIRSKHLKLKHELREIYARTENMNEFLSGIYQRVGLTQ